MIQEKNNGKKAADEKTAADGSSHEYVDLGLSVKWAGRLWNR